MNEFKEELLEIAAVLSNKAFTGHMRTKQQTALNRLRDIQAVFDARDLLGAIHEIDDLDFHGRLHRLHRRFNALSTENNRLLKIIQNIEHADLISINERITNLEGMSQPRVAIALSDVEFDELEYEARRLHCDMCDGTCFACVHTNVTDMACLGCGVEHDQGCSHNE